MTSATSLNDIADCYMENCRIFIKRTGTPKDVKNLDKDIKTIKSSQTNYDRYLQRIIESNEETG